MALVALALAGGCTSRPDASSRVRDRIVVARPSDATNLDPARASDIESLEVAEQVFGRLVRFTAGRLEPEPDLATSWSVSADGTVWTFDLRPGVLFHDGTAFDADAVVFSFERQIVADHPAHEPDFVWARSYRNIRRVVALSRLRVQFQIDRPYAPFLANLAIGPAAIVSPAAVRRWGTKFGRHPVGTGPYRFLEWIPGDRITLERNNDYWDQRAKTRATWSCCKLSATPASECRRWQSGQSRHRRATGSRRRAAGAPGSRPAHRVGAGVAGGVYRAQHPAPSVR